MKPARVRTLGKKKVSRSTRKEPAGAKTLRATYEKKLIRLWKLYRKEAEDALRTSPRAMASFEPAPGISISWLSDHLRDLREQFHASGKTIIAEQMERSHFAGTAAGEKALRKVGILVDVMNGPPDWRAIDALQVRNFSVLEGITAETNKQIVSELTEGLNRGEGMEALARRLRNKVDAIGIHRSRLMARTETMYAFNEGTKLRYKQHAIGKVEWLTAYDDRTCPDCSALNGKVFAIDDEIGRAHV